VQPLVFHELHCRSTAEFRLKPVHPGEVLSEEFLKPLALRACEKIPD
jgi:hypothetical protein